MLEQSIIDPIVKGLLYRFVEGDRVEFSICGSFDHPRYPLLTGTVIKMDKRFVTVRMDHEDRKDMKNQVFYIGNSNLRVIDNECWN